MNALPLCKAALGRLAPPLGTAVIALTLCLIPARAQDAGVSAPNPSNAHATLRIPASSQAQPGDTGTRAHTNVRFIVPAGMSPDEAAPPYAGYGYETPASLACIYELVTPISGCNPNTTTKTPEGGSESIAIVDAYDLPDALAELTYFSSQFGVPFDPSLFKVVYESGKAPAMDPSGGWELEESLDIEYAHAMAPKAMLYLVEANSNGYNDLFGAVIIASNLVRCGKTTTCPANAKGKGEISMSWGGTEFQNESLYDTYLKAANVVYLAAAGDEPGVLYPSASPDVISVGGTSNARNINTGNLIAQIAWSDAGGGLSYYEPTPPYQKVIARIAQGARATPDVSAVANPYTGVWVYDTVPYEGTTAPGNWWIVGGTSVATPVWAGILNSAATHSGGKFAASTEDELYLLYGDLAEPGRYTPNLWDITYGACNYYSGSFSQPGYDLCTGLGSPKTLAWK